VEYEVGNPTTRKTQRHKCSEATEARLTRFGKELLEKFHHDAFL